MNRPDCCAYPPRLAPDVDITAQTEAASPSFIVGSAAAGRYLILGAAERYVVDLLDGSRTLTELCEHLTSRDGAGPQSSAVIRFLARLDDVGILAGERAGRRQEALLSGSQFYLRWSLFNPEPLFARLIPALRWIWTPWFFSLSALLIAAMALVALTNRVEVSRYATQTLREHYLAVFAAAWLVTTSHEFAHGMTSRVFGGRATEVGALLIYYCLPALYCNVSGLHLISKRGRRLWVIAAGIYWQLLVGASSLLVWSLFYPDTFVAGVAMVFVLGSLLDVVFNINPLIKLDGYYFLSQWLRIPNLMDRSRACWRALLRGVLLGEQSPETCRLSERERHIALVFGFFSFFYNLALPVVIVWYAAQYLMDWFYFPGLLLAALLGLGYAWRPLKQMLARKEGNMAPNVSDERRLRRFVPAVVALGVAVGLCMPWTASVGSYGTLTAIPGREVIIRAAEGASLIALEAKPGQHVAPGATIGRLGNLDLEEQIVQVRTELARVNADADRLTGELRVQQAANLTLESEFIQRRREFTDVDDEERQIGARPRTARRPGLVTVSNAAPQAQQLPAALAVVEADADLLRIKLSEANRQRDRARSLFAEGLLSRSDMDAVDTRSSTLAIDLAGAQERLSAALIEHQRRHASKAAEVEAAESSVSAGRAQISNLKLQQEAARRLRGSLEERLGLLERKHAQFALVSPGAGTLFGEELPRMIGQYFPKGGAIARVVNTSELLVRVQVAEQALGDVAVGQRVRVKTRAFSDDVFHGVVSKIGGESEQDSNGQRSYRVEMTIQNKDGRLRPGMTVFARIDFGRHIVAWLLAHKVKQALRPELWML